MHSDSVARGLETTMTAVMAAAKTAEHQARSDSGLSRLAYQDDQYFFGNVAKQPLHRRKSTAAGHVKFWSPVVGSRGHQGQRAEGTITQ